MICIVIPIVSQIGCLSNTSLASLHGLWYNCHEPLADLAPYGVNTGAGRWKGVNWITLSGRGHETGKTDGCLQTALRLCDRIALRINRNSWPSVDVWMMSETLAQQMGKNAGQVRRLRLHKVCDLMEG